MSKTKTIRVPIPYPVKWVNCYYIMDSIPTLIDTGVNTNAALDIITSAIESEGGKLEDIRRIIATHGHADHIGLAGRLTGRNGAQVFVHPWDTVQWAAGDGDRFKDKREDFRAFFLEAGMPEGLADEVAGLILERYGQMCSPLLTETMMGQGMEFGFDDFNLQVVHTPGHSPGSVSLFNQEDGTLFTGDTILPEIISNPSIEKTGSAAYKSLTSHLESLELIKGLGVKKILPGHGAPFKDVEARIRGIVGHHTKRSKQVLRILAQEESASKNHDGMTQFTVATELYGSLSGIETFFAISATRGYLDALEEQGLATRAKAGPSHLYWLSV